MAGDSKAPEEAEPFSDLAAWLVEQNYRELGCNGWNTRRVQRLMAKLGVSQRTMAAFLRIRPSSLDQRLTNDGLTKQDGLILTLLERAVDMQKGQVQPEGDIFKLNTAAVPEPAGALHG